MHFPLLKAFAPLHKALNSHTEGVLWPGYVGGLHPWCHVHVSRHLMGPAHNLQIFNILRLLIKAALHKGEHDLLPILVRSFGQQTLDTVPLSPRGTGPHAIATHTMSTREEWW